MKFGGSLIYSTRRRWRFCYFNSGTSIGTIVSEVTWLPTPRRCTLLQYTISGLLADETCVSACGGRNLLKGAIALMVERSRMVQKKNYYHPKPCPCFTWRTSFKHLRVKVSVWGSKQVKACVVAFAAAAAAAYQWDQHSGVSFAPHHGDSCRMADIMSSSRNTSLVYLEEHRAGTSRGLIKNFIKGTGGCMLLNMEDILITWTRLCEYQQLPGSV